MLKGEERLIGVFRDLIRKKEDVIAFESTDIGQAVIAKAQEQSVKLLRELAVVDCEEEGWERKVKHLRRELDVVISGVYWMSQAVQDGESAEDSLRATEEKTEEY